MWTRDFNDVKRKRKIKERLCNDLDKNLHRKLGKHSGELPRRQKAKKKRSSTIYHSCIFDESYTGFIFNFGISSCIALKDAQIQILFSSLQCGFPKLEKISVPASKRKNKWKLISCTHKMLVQWHICILTEIVSFTPSPHRACLTCTSCQWGRRPVPRPPWPRGHIQQLSE